MLSAAQDRRDREMPSREERVRLRVVRVESIGPDGELHTDIAQAGAIVAYDQGEARVRDDTPPTIMFVAILLGLGFWIGVAVAIFG